MPIPEDQLESFRERVIGAKRPLIFYDDDSDGLCSYLLCLHARGEALGVRIQQSATVMPEQLRKIEENAPDLIVVLDKPYIHADFIAGAQVPIVWLDHHEPQTVPGNVTYYNPRVGDNEDNRCTTYWVWKALGKPEDLWIAAIGSISDWQLTDIADAFYEQYPDILPRVNSPPEALFGAHRFGDLCRIFQFNLKGEASEVRTAIRILGRITDPYELLEHSTPRAKLLYKRYVLVAREYERLLQLARSKAGTGPVLFCMYPHVEISLLAEVSNHLVHDYPEKLIFVAREHNGEVKLSLRSGGNYDVAAAVKSAMSEDIRGNAGGHTHACGGNIKLEDFPRFKALLLTHLGLNG